MNKKQIEEANITTMKTFMKKHYLDFNEKFSFIDKKNMKVIDGRLFSFDDSEIIEYRINNNYNLEIKIDKDSKFEDACSICNDCQINSCLYNIILNSDNLVKPYYKPRMDEPYFCIKYKIDYDRAITYEINKVTNTLSSFDKKMFINENSFKTRESAVEVAERNKLRIKKAIYID